MPILTLITFLLVLSVLVLVHEFGHFIMARFAGVGVEEFALGLPFTKPVWQKKLKDGLLVSLYPVLFGGFVKLLGEEEQREKGKGQKVKGHYFYEVGVGKRIGVVVAGATMNALLAFAVFYLFLLFSGFKVLVPILAEYKFISPVDSNRAVVVSFVDKDTPAETAGLKAGDVIVSADGKKFEKFTQFQLYTKSKAGQPMRVDISDTTLSDSRQLTVVPRVDPPQNQGPLGIAIAEAAILDYGEDKLASGLKYGADMFAYNFVVLRSFVDTAIKTKDAGIVTEGVAGPIGIGNAIGIILQAGGKQAILNLLNLIGLLGLSLAFMNIFPFPALDGGRLAFLLLEAATGKKIPLKWETRVHQAGMVILLGVMVLVSYFDVMKFLTPLWPKK
jgi:regulator of sigma E protease